MLSYKRCRFFNHKILKHITYIVLHIYCFYHNIIECFVVHYNYYNSMSILTSIACMMCKHSKYTRTTPKRINKNL